LNLYLYLYLYLSSFSPIQPKAPPDVIAIYRPPSTYVAQLFSDFSDLLTQALLGERPITLACDFNIHVDDLNDTNAKSF